MSLVLNFANVALLLGLFYQSMTATSYLTVRAVWSEKLKDSGLILYSLLYMIPFAMHVNVALLMAAQRLLWFGIIGLLLLALYVLDLAILGSRPQNKRVTWTRHAIIPAVSAALTAIAFLMLG